MPSFILLSMSILSTICIVFSSDPKINIMNTERLTSPRAIDIDDEQEVRKKIEENENVILIFHTDWCPHW